MKRKLFTLLLAFMALASFQANAADIKYLIHAADTDSTRTGTKWQIPQSTTGPWTTANYASVDSLSWPAKLNPLTWKWETGAPTNTDKKVVLKQGIDLGANFTRFVQAENENNVLKLVYAGITYDKFVIFRADSSLTSAILVDQPKSAANWRENKDVDHLGYLSVNTVTSARDTNIVIVLVRTGANVTIDENLYSTGSLMLQTLKWYQQNQRAGWAPFAFYADPAVGHWATTADFIGSKYWKFANLPVAEAEDLQKNPNTTKKFDTFSVTQVDWISRGDSTRQSGENMFGNENLNYYNTKFDSIGGDKNKGLQLGVKNPKITLTPNLDSVIPLFILSSPENSCKVVSVSRLNGLTTQTHADGGYANKLELRDYATYYDYHKNDRGIYDIYSKETASRSATWDAHRGTDMAGSPALNEYRVATSLQKFAIWIDEDGAMTVYPAASYFWQYGESKENQPSKVVPNSVLIYNNIGITQSSGGVVSADKGWGIQIDSWHNLASGVTQNEGEIMTGPNVIQENSNYKKTTHEPTIPTLNASDIAGKFFFLDAGKLSPLSNTSLAGRPNAYQDNKNTEYVLSTQRFGSQMRLVVVPKEKVRGYANETGNLWYDQLKSYKKIEGGSLLPEYWSNNPYDSVNMAAHWGIYPTASGKYLLINMLGDTLQYNIGASTQYITGGYATSNNNIADTNRFSPEGGSDSKWFNANANASGTGTSNEWTVSTIPGKDGFVLNLNGYELAIDTAAWYQNNIHAKTDSVYFQQNVNLAANNFGNVDSLAIYNQVGNFSCAGGLMLKRSEIYYVPNYSGSYGTEANNNVINTNDPNFKDGKVVSDSLTAYLLLHGVYGIKEATLVNNDLLLGTDTTEMGIFAAALKRDGQTNITFTPLSEVARTRNANIRAAANASLNLLTDTLYGETYKWFIVQDAAGRYLVFDTINATSLDNRLKVGFTFQKTNIANATPVRLYQPLVGDKLQGNFIFQFYQPENTYAFDANGVAQPTKSSRNKWPDVEGAFGSTWLGSRQLFGQLSNQSNYINGVTEKSKATRFTYVLEAAVSCDCPEQFIAPNWMAAEKLLGLPLMDRIIVSGAMTDYGFGTTSRGKAGAVNTNVTQLKHTFVDSIKPYATHAGQNGYVIRSEKTNKTDTVWGFYNDVTVPLYYIQNDAGLYLTVDTTTWQYDSRSTDTDVTGVNLIWKEKLDSTNAYNQDKNLRALQLFAISGYEGDPLDGWYPGCKTYVYLPLASYKATYSTGKVDPSKIYYNLGLGKGKIADCVDDRIPTNDVSKAFRVAQWSQIGDNEKTLVVVNSTGSGATSNVPVEVKWKKNVYDIIGCDYQLVRDVKNVNDKFFYAAGGSVNDPANGKYKYDTLCTANSNTLLAHWQIKHDAKDPYLHTFAPEVVMGYGKDLTVDNKQLKGDGYYFLKTAQRGDTTVARVFDFTNYNSTGKYAITEKAFEIICVDHTLPFADLEKDEWNYELPAQLAILESTFVDRNLSDTARGHLSSPLIRNNSYQVYANEIGQDIKKANYLTAYKIQDRRLGAGVNSDGSGHDIPYYAFSLKKNGKEYFLNVRTAAQTGASDSVYWTSINSADSAKLFAGSGDMKLYQFCLPYRVDENGKRVAKAKYGESEYSPVYLQTLDTSRTDYPYLVITGSSTSYVTAKRLDIAILDNKNACAHANSSYSLAWNIYTVDYAQIDKNQVTSWIFGGEQPGEFEWVPLFDVAGGLNNGKNVDGVLTNYKLQGVTFVAESGMTPNYGILFNKKDTLHFEYEGTERIGSPWKLPIFYYRIQGPSGGWLTDAYEKTTADYIYTWGNPTPNPYKIAYFDPTKITNNVNGTVAGTQYDKNYVQTFGLRYYNVDVNPPLVGDYKNPKQTFVVVSNANYTNAKPNDYRYLAEVNGHLVFVKGIENALVFQYGQKDANGYTGIEIAGASNVVGVQGGVRLQNQAGNKVDFYSVDGSLIKSVVVTGADQTIAAPRGVVIVKVAGNATKVVVK